MLPVSGAEQFVTSEPMCPDRPMISAMTAYCDTNTDREQRTIAERVCKRTYFEVSQGDTVFGIMSLAQEKVPETELAGFCLELFDDRDDGLPPRGIIRELGFSELLGRPDLLLPTSERHMSRNIGCY
jgi:hypothetical protein